MARARARTTVPKTLARSSGPASSDERIPLPHARVHEEDALVASAQRVTPKVAQEIRRVAQAWQSLALSYYDRLGEIHYAANFHANAIAKLRLYVGEVDDDGEVEETENEQAAALLARIRDPGSPGRSQLQGSYARLLFLTGEPLLLWSKTVDTDEERWEIVSTDEIVLDGGRMERRVAPGMSPVQLRYYEKDGGEPSVEEAVVFRLWRPHPRWSHLADSPMRAVLELCDELFILQQAVRARAVSRLAGAGILLLPSEGAPPPAQGAVGDEDPNNDPLLQDLIRHFTTPIKDQGSASAVVPYILRYGGDYIDKIKHLQIHDPTQTYPEEGLRSEAIRRIALGLDLPPEVLLGMTDANHWTAWQVEQQTWKSHLLPVATKLCSDLTAAYLRPNAKAEGIEGWENLVVAYDAAELLSNPDKSKDAQSLHSLGVLSDDALREAAGFGEADEPSKDERNTWLAIQLNDKSLVPGLPAVDGAEAPDGSMGPGMSDQTPPDENTGQDETVDPEMSGDMVASGVPRVTVAAEMAVARAREKAGIRMKGRVQHTDAATLVASVAVENIVATLGPDRLAGLDESVDVLVAGATGPFVSVLERWGVSSEQAAALAQLVERHAARTLLDEDPPLLPPGFTAAARAALQ